MTSRLTMLGRAHWQQPPAGPWTAGCFAPKCFGPFEIFRFLFFLSAALQDADAAKDCAELVLLRG